MTNFAPFKRALQTSKVLPSKAKLLNCEKLSFGVTFKVFSIVVTLIIAWCGTRTPLGFPVEPEVYISYRGEMADISDLGLSLLLFMDSKYMLLIRKVWIFDLCVLDWYCLSVIINRGFASFRISVIRLSGAKISNGK